MAPAAGPVRFEALPLGVNSNGYVENLGGPKEKKKKKGKKRRQHPLKKAASMEKIDSLEGTLQDWIIFIFPLIFI